MDDAEDAADQQECSVKVHVSKVGRIRDQQHTRPEVTPMCSATRCSSAYRSRSLGVQLEIFLGGGQTWFFFAETLRISQKMKQWSHGGASLFRQLQQAKSEGNQALVYRLAVQGLSFTTACASPAILKFAHDVGVKNVLSLMDITDWAQAIPEAAEQLYTRAEGLVKQQNEKAFSSAATLLGRLMTLMSPPLVDLLARQHVDPSKPRLLENSVDKVVLRLRQKLVSIASKMELLLRPYPELKANADKQHQTIAQELTSADAAGSVQMKGNSEYCTVQVDAKTDIGRGHEARISKVLAVLPSPEGHAVVFAEKTYYFCEAGQRQLFVDMVLNARLHHQQHQERSTALLQTLAWNCDANAPLSHTIRAALEPCQCNLRQYLQGAKLGSEHVLSLALQILKGLSVLHNLGVVHNDLKADNVLIACAHLEFPRVKIGDLGLATFVTPQRQQSCPLRVGELQGPPQSPESSAGKPHSFPHDIYCFGMLMQQLCGRDNNDPLLNKIVLDCMQMDPTKRPSADDLLLLLQKQPQQQQFSDIPEQKPLQQQQQQQPQLILPEVKTAGAAMVSEPIDLDSTIEILKPYFFGTEIIHPTMSLSPITIGQHVIVPQITVVQEAWEDAIRGALRNVKRQQKGDWTLWRRMDCVSTRRLLMDILETLSELRCRPTLRGFEEDHARKLMELYTGSSVTAPTTKEGVLARFCHALLHCRREPLLSEQNETSLGAAVDLVYGAVKCSEHPVNILCLTRSEAETRLKQQQQQGGGGWLLRFNTPRVEADQNWVRVSYGWNVILSCLTRAGSFVHLPLVACNPSSIDRRTEMAYFVDVKGNAQLTFRFLTSTASAICDGARVLEAPPGMRYTKRHRMAQFCVVYWDYDNSPVPRGMAVEKVVTELQKFGSTLAQNVGIMAFTNQANTGDGNRVAELKRTGVHVEVVPVRNLTHLPGRSENVDKKMIATMSQAQRNRGDVCIIVTGDTGFQEAMGNLVQHGCDVVLLYSGQPPPSFTEDGRWKVSMHWMQFLSVPALKPSARPCNHFNRNVCTLDDKCCFAHVCSSCGSTDHGSFACPETGKVVSPCRWFVAGHCKYTDKCRHPHQCTSCTPHAGEHASNCPVALKWMASQPMQQLPQLEPPPPPCLEACHQKFFCPDGLGCKKFHSQAERECFQNNGGKGVQKYRIDMCRQGLQCTRRTTCTFAHDQSEMVCHYCAARQDHIMQTCPKRIVDRRRFSLFFLER